MIKLRLQITKGEAVRYSSHLDYARTMERALRRAKLPVAYSEGFNPHMKMAFASALSLGVTSEAEYLDVELKESVDCGEFAAALSAELPDGIVLKRLREIPAGQGALMAMVNQAVYRVAFPLPDCLTYPMAVECVGRFNLAEQVQYIKESPKGRRQVEVKQYLAKNIIAVATPGGLELELTIRITANGSIKPSEVLNVLIDQFDLAVDRNAAIINRTGLFINSGSVSLSPLDAGLSSPEAGND